MHIHPSNFIGSLLQISRSRGASCLPVFWIYAWRLVDEGQWRINDGWLVIVRPVAAVVVASVGWSVAAAGVSVVGALVVGTLSPPDATLAADALVLDW